VQGEVTRSNAELDDLVLLRGDGVPNLGAQRSAQEIAALERQYYARSLGQMRTQYSRPSRNVARPVRPAGRRR